MTNDENLIYNRPPFDPNGVLVARAQIKVGARVLNRGERLPKNHGLDAHRIKSLWDHAHIDTLPRATGSFFGPKRS